jgi:hypothetical protein
MISAADRYLLEHGWRREPGVEKMLNHPVGHVKMRKNFDEGCSNQFADSIPARHNGRRSEDGSRRVGLMECDDAP